MQISSSAESRLTERRRQQPLEISSSTNTSHNRTVGFSPVPIIKVVLPILAIVASVVLHTQLPPFRTSQTMSSKTLPHIVVVGGGLAGLSAAAEALASGVRVTIIDKQQLGGNSAKATSGINAVLTRHQFASGITNDSISLFMGDVLKSGQGRTDRRLAHTLSARSTDAVTFLEEKLGHELSNVAILGGHSCPRTHRFSTASGSKPMPVGFTVISALKKFLNDEKWKGKIEVCIYLYSEQLLVAIYSD